MSRGLLLHRRHPRQLVLSLYTRQSTSTTSQPFLATYSILRWFHTQNGVVGVVWRLLGIPALQKRTAAARVGRDSMHVHVTVCVCTRNRGASIARALRSILASTYEEYDIVVVDQSDGDDTEDAVRHIDTGSKRCHYLRSDTRGSSAGHNVAVAHAVGPLLAFTDDDCAVSPDWLASLVDHFRRYPDVGLIFGQVGPGPHDARAGFIPTCEVPRLRRVSSPWMKWRERGIGANMALPAAVLERVGPFDEILGSGGRLYANLDGDMAYRVLRAGYPVLNIPDARVIHYGFRPWEQGSPMMRRVGIGVGATYMKHLLLGDIAVVPTLLIEWLRCISWQRLALLRPRSGVGRFLGYTRGMFLSFTYPKDRSTRTFTPNQTGPAADAAAPVITTADPVFRLTPR